MIAIFTDRKGFQKMDSVFDPPCQIWRIPLSRPISVFSTQIDNTTPDSVDETYITFMLKEVYKGVAFYEENI